VKNELLTRQVALDFHDAELLCVSHRRLKSELRLDFTVSDLKVQSIVCGGVHVFRVADIVRQNIVSRILVSSWHQFMDLDMTRKINWANSLNDTPISISSSVMVKYAQNIASGDWSLMVVEPSCGAEIVVVCDSVVVTDQI
jgi:hypothetical protein